ncbi:hypothetical protein [Streptomyces sp. NPDC001404]|uniref:DUF7848 domain-containing protein n=1 Tax=Streptomyces sp. NPDC001404 TaxID=3364571 RepID=UPI00368EE58C
MSGKNAPIERQDPPDLPVPGALMVDGQGRIGEFRGMWCGRWSLRPVAGGTEWTVAPADAQPASPEQRLGAEVTRANARSRGVPAIRGEYAFFDFTISPDMDPDAPPMLYRFRCLGEDDDGTPCGAESEESEDFEEARGWTFKHKKDQPEHTSYEEVLRRPWIMRPGRPA